MSSWPFVGSDKKKKRRAAKRNSGGMGPYDSGGVDNSALLADEALSAAAAPADLNTSYSSYASARSGGGGGARGGRSACCSHTLRARAHLFALVSVFACCGAVAAVFVLIALAGPYDALVVPLLPGAQVYGTVALGVGVCCAALAGFYVALKGGHPRAEPWRASLCPCCCELPCVGLLCRALFGRGCCAVQTYKPRRYAWALVAFALATAQLAVAVQARVFSGALDASTATPDEAAAIAALQQCTRPLCCPAAPAPAPTKAPGPAALAAAAWAQAGAGPAPAPAPAPAPPPAGSDCRAINAAGKDAVCALLLGGTPGSTAGGSLSCASPAPTWPADVLAWALSRAADMSWIVIGCGIGELACVLLAAFVAIRRAPDVERHYAEDALHRFDHRRRCLCCCRGKTEEQCEAEDRALLAAQGRGVTDYSSRSSRKKKKASKYKKKREKIKEKYLIEDDGKGRNGNRNGNGGGGGGGGGASASALEDAATTPTKAGSDGGTATTPSSGGLLSRMGGWFRGGEHEDEGLPASPGLRDDPVLKALREESPRAGDAAGDDAAGRNKSGSVMDRFLAGEYHSSDEDERNSKSKGPPVDVMDLYPDTPRTGDGGGGTPASPPPPELKTGWLEKEGGWRKSWKRRFFVLTGASLSYYAEDRPGAAPKGTIDLDDVVRCVDHEPAAGDKSGKAFNTFAVETLQRTYFVRAATHGERHAWVQAINGASLNP